MQKYWQENLFAKVFAIVERSEIVNLVAPTMSLEKTWLQNQCAHRCSKWSKKKWHTLTKHYVKKFKIQEISHLAHGNTWFNVVWVLHDAKKEYNQQWSWIEKHVMLNTNVVCNKKINKWLLFTQLQWKHKTMSINENFTKPTQHSHNFF